MRIKFRLRLAHQYAEITITEIEGWSEEYRNYFDIRLKNFRIRSAFTPGYYVNEICIWGENEEEDYIEYPAPMLTAARTFRRLYESTL